MALMTESINVQYLCECRGKDYDDIPFEQTKLLVDQMRKGDKKAREKLIKTNLRLVMHFAKNFAMRNPDANINDLVQEGNLGLIIAVDRYEPERNVKLNTYAGFWIRWYMERYVKEQLSDIRVPTSAVDLYGKIKHAQGIYAKTNGRLPSAEELEALICVPAETIKRSLAFKKYTKSFNEPISNDADKEDGDCTLEEAISDETNVIDKSQENLENRDEVYRLLSWLKPLEKYVIIQNFGIDCQPSTLMSIGKELGCSKSNLQAIKDAGIQKLREMLGDNKTFNIKQHPTEQKRPLKSNKLYDLSEELTWED